MSDWTLGFGRGYSFLPRPIFFFFGSAGGGKYLEVCKYLRRPRREKPRIREEEVSYRKDTSFSCASRFVSSISRVPKSVKTFDQYIRECVLTRCVKICGLIFVTPSPPSTSRSNNNFFFVLRQHVFGSSSEGEGGGGQRSCDDERLLKAEWAEEEEEDTVYTEKMARKGGEEVDFGVFFSPDRPDVAATCVIVAQLAFSPSPLLFRLRHCMLSVWTGAKFAIVHKKFGAKFFFTV